MSLLQFRLIMLDFARSQLHCYGPAGKGLDDFISSLPGYSKLTRYFSSEAEWEVTEPLTKWGSTTISNLDTFFGGSFSWKPLFLSINMG